MGLNRSRVKQGQRGLNRVNEGQTGLNGLNPLKPGVWERLVIPRGGAQRPPPTKSMKEWRRTPSCYLEVGPL